MLKKWIFFSLSSYSFISQIQIPIINSELQVNIEQKEPGDAHKTLVCYKTLTGCEKVQIKQLKDKAYRYGSQAKNSKMYTNKNANNSKCNKSNTNKNE